jgi:hypothetical protein
LNTSRENIEIDKEVDGRGYRRQAKGLMGGRCRRQAKGLMGGRQEAGKRVDGRGGAGGRLRLPKW